MKSSVMTLSKRDARRLALAHSGLHAKASFGRGKSGVLKAIKRLSYVQIDTISVIHRAHHHVFFCRVPNYRPAFLQELVSKDKKILEYWAHAAAYLPMEDFRYTYHVKQFFRDKKDRWPKPSQELMKKVYRRIQKEGPLMARDFEDVRPEGGGWWNMKPAKWALERLFMEGDLVIKERRGFQKVYDLPERVVPDCVDTSVPTRDEYVEHLVNSALRAHGIISVPGIIYLRKGLKGDVADCLESKYRRGELLKVKVKGVDKKMYYVNSKHRERTTIRINKDVRFLSPFDNVVIQRDRLGDLFDFNYQLECYVPRKKRKYGYFCLPILHGDSMVGRLDAKADRRTLIFHLYNLHLDADKKKKWPDANKLARALREFADFHGCHDFIVHKTEPSVIQGELQHLLDAK